ncbi:class I SAM-dependent methyltransferase [Streptomyces lydicus]|uniref:class I SAM-dependent methyltransferase n=1 Tax=Streptomyces lydicus TaxID=47763 RepID=UPI0010112F20|nr:class I SAM-dependent methyltransferase [Streptomyces lydicus]MCZ1012195.1 class I SAM-dependent methyltransferase [Streptomyces lydicus]
MIRPDQPASAAASDDALFGAEAADYARYRSGLPDAAVRLLAATQHDVPAPILLDLGTGTGQVPRVLLPVLDCLVHIDLVDVNESMLEAARAALEPADSAFSDVAKHAFPVSRTWRPEDVLGYLRTTSFARPALFAGHHGEFEDAALRQLQDHARGGALKEDAVFTVLLARRPGGDA